MTGTVFNLEQENSDQENIEMIFLKEGMTACGNYLNFFK